MEFSYYTIISYGTINGKQPMPEIPLFIVVSERHSDKLDMPGYAFCRAFAACANRSGGLCANAGNVRLSVDCAFTLKFIFL